MPSMECSESQEGLKGVEGWIEIFHPLILFFLELLKRFDDAFLEEILEMEAFLQKIKELTTPKSTASVHQRRKFDRDFGELKRFHSFHFIVFERNAFSTLFQKSGNKELTAELTKKLEDLRANLRKTNSKIAIYAEPPGFVQNSIRETSFRHT